jgi:hypothetical protein
VRRSRGQKRQSEGGDRGAAGSLYPAKAARGRVVRSGKAKPELAAHRQSDLSTCAWDIRGKAEEKRDGAYFNDRKSFSKARLTT